MIKIQFYNNNYQKKLKYLLFKEVIKFQIYISIKNENILQKINIL
jgi:hypothetical protein